MNAQEFLSKLKVLFVGYNFGDISNIGSIYGTIDKEIKQFRNFDGSTIRINGFRSIYVSGIMYEGVKPIEEQFVYCIIKTYASRRGYRCKKFVDDYEYDKFFESAKTYDLLYQRLESVINKIS